MTTILTAAGDGHMNSLLLGGGGTQPFDGILFGAGNNAPLSTDTQVQITSKILNALTEVDEGYPRENDLDARNNGRAPTTWTWRFTLTEGAAFIASNLAVCNFNGGQFVVADPLLVSADVVTGKRADQVLVVFLNITATKSPSLTLITEEGNVAPEQVASWRRRTLASAGSPGSQLAEGHAVRSRLPEGDGVRTSAYLENDVGDVLTPSDVAFVELAIYRRTGMNTWDYFQSQAMTVESVVPAAPVRTARFFLGARGYNFTHFWVPPLDFGGRHARLEYRIKMQSGAIVTLVHVVDFTPVLR